jgi:flagellar motor component MotA
VIQTSEYTSIQIEKNTKDRILQFKEYSRETYDEILNKLMKIVEMVKKEGVLTEEINESIERGKKDIKQGKTYSTKEVLKILEG